MISKGSPPTLKVQNHFYLSTYPKTFGNNIKTKLTIWVSNLKKLFSQVVKILILELECMQAVMTLIMHSIISLIKLLRIIMDISRLINMLVIWIIVSLILHHWTERMLL
jgi:hypothetical protein